MSCSQVGLGSVTLDRFLPLHEPLLSSSVKWDPHLDLLTNATCTPLRMNGCFPLFERLVIWREEDEPYHPRVTPEAFSLLMLKMTSGD